MHVCERGRGEWANNELTRKEACFRFSIPFSGQNGEIERFVLSGPMA